MKFKKKLFEIDNFLSIQKTCQYALDNSKMIGILGYPGAGKTWALKHFLKNNLNVNYLKVRPSMKAIDFYTRLLQLHNPNTKYLKKSMYQVLNDLRNLILDGEKKLLIIDEAGQFEISDLEYIHEFRDLTEESLGIILAGPEYFYDDILEHVKRQTPGISEFNRRISMKILLERPKEDEILDICKGHGIKDINLIETRFAKHSDFSALSDDIEQYLVFEKDF